MKKIVGLVVIALVAIWFTVTLQTGKATVTYFTEQLEEMEALYSDIVSVEVEWQKQGRRKASGILRVSPVNELPMGDVQWIEEFQLTHGFLRSRLKGSADFKIDEWLLSDYYGEQGITSTGVFSARGGAIEYVLAEIEYSDDGGTITHEPAFLRIVLTEDTQHSEFHLPSLHVSEEANGRTVEGLVIKDFVMRYQAELNERRWPERQEMSYAIGLLGGEYLPFAVENFLTQFNWQRVQEQIEFILKVKAPTGHYLNNDFSAELSLQGGGFDYEAAMLLNDQFQRINGDLDDELVIAELERIVEAFVAESVHAGFSAELEHLIVNYESLGRLNAIGTAGIEPMDIDALDEATFDAWMQYFNANIELQELPELMRVSLLSLGVPDRAMPWILQYNPDTGVSINGQLLVE